MSGHARWDAIAWCILLPLVAAVPPLPAQDDTARTTVLFAGRAAGAHKAWTTPDGARHYSLEFNDRGRGPVLRQRTVLGPDGQPTSVEISGQSYLETPVTERFTLEPRGSRWLARWRRTVRSWSGRSRTLPSTTSRPTSSSAR